MHHQHQFVPHEPRAPPVVTVTRQSTVTQPGYSTPAAGYDRGGYDTGGYDTAEPSSSPTYRVGAPVTGSRIPPYQSPAPKPDYSAPSRQRHRVHSTQPAGTNGNGHHHHGNAPAANGHHQHHHKVGTPVNVKISPSTPGAMKTTLAPGSDAHQDTTGTGSSLTTQDQGMSTGAKAGLAIGLLLVFAFVGAVIFLLYRRQKSKIAAHQTLDDEKTDLNKSHGSLSPHVSVRRTVASAPRLSLRPVTEMFPAMSEKSDNAAASTLIAQSAASARPKGPDSTRPVQTNAEVATNPFGDDAEAIDGDDRNVLTAPAAVVPKPLSVKSERTGSELSDGSPSVNGQALAAPGAPGAPPKQSSSGPGPNNVHRVQLDFNPSMDDELGLRAGQLVRMLHEYDDGWALCIRLDRSQQGVVPRTCISKLPVKPRPQGPPGNMRGPPPQIRPRGPPNAPVPRGQSNDPRQRPMGPQGGRMRSQSNAPHQPRPQSPGAFGGQTIAPQGRPRANSDALSGRGITSPSVSPPNSAGTSPTQVPKKPNRKPVPGQAL